MDRPSTFTLGGIAATATTPVALRCVHGSDARLPKSVLTVNSLRTEDDAVNIGHGGGERTVLRDMLDIFGGIPV